MKPPTREQIGEVLVSLAQGTIGVEEAASWAYGWMSREDADIDDEVVWDALDPLAGADLQTAPGVYLHGREDFESWLVNFRRQCEPHES